MDFTELATALALRAAYLDVQAMERTRFGDSIQVFNDDETSRAAFLSFCVEAWGVHGIAQGVLDKGGLTYLDKVN